MYPPPPGYVPPKPRKRGKESASFGREVFRTTAKLVNGYNKATSLHALAAIAHELRTLFRG